MGPGPCRAAATVGPVAQPQGRGYAPRVSPRAFRNLTGLQAVAMLAATFAVVWGALLPYAAHAAAQPGLSIVLCSVEGPKSVTIDPETGQVSTETEVPSCPACVVPPLAVLPPAPATPLPRIFAKAAQPAPRHAALRLPPARAPPRPPSTAPPHA